MAPFRCLSEHELQQLSDEELIAYANEARGEGKHDCWLLAMKMLVWGFHRRVEFWVRRKVDENDVDDLASEVFDRALTSLPKETAQFTGSTTGEFGAWLRRITQFVIADYYRDKEGDPPIDSLGPGTGEDDEPYRREPFEPDQTDEVVNQALVDQAVEELNDLHKRVIKIIGDVAFGFDGKPAGEAVRQVNDGTDGGPPEAMTLANAYQIKTRFKLRVAELMDEADNPGGTDA